MKNQRIALINKFANFIQLHEGLILLLIFHFLLRIPNLFEPYWYGDEGIYLTIGNALQHGAKLYAEIVDHKTPLIYYFAMMPSQFWFRIINIIWMTMSVALFFQISKKLKFTIFQQYLSTLLFIIFSSLPWLEGNIPNGELFVIGFVLWGVWLYLQTNFFSNFISGGKTILKNEWKKTLFAGFFFGLAVLTKVPAILDVFTFGVVGLFVFLPTLFNKDIKVLKIIIRHWIILITGFFIPIFLSILYYYLRGTLQSYLDFGLLYNFRYAGSWGLPFTQPFLVFLFSLKGKALILVSGILLTIALNKRISGTSKLLIIWTLASWFGATLSSRPYPHYLLQLVPSCSLLLTWIIRKQKIQLDLLATLLASGLIISTIILLRFSFYPAVSYYHRFFKYITKQETKAEYFQQFDGLMNENYEMAKYIISSSDPQFFIWGTNPTLYALTKKYPTGRFIVSFHIKDFPGAFEETYNDLVLVGPEHIVVMKNEEARFDNFYAYLSQNYLMIKETQQMRLFKRLPEKIL